MNRGLATLLREGILCAFAPRNYLGEDCLWTSIIANRNAVNSQPVAIASFARRPTQISKTAIPWTGGFTAPLTILQILIYPKTVTFCT